MKNYSTLILTIILIILIILGYFLYQNIETEKIKKNGDEISTVYESTQSEDNIQEEAVETPESTESIIEVIGGMVAGKLCYPSEYIPQLDIYLLNTETEQYITLETDYNTFEYEIENVPAGKYQIFAYVKGLDDEFGGGYTEAVPCGLTVECEDHALIEFKVLSNDTTVDIDICDWYGADVPGRPQL